MLNRTVAHNTSAPQKINQENLDYLLSTYAGSGPNISLANLLIEKGYTTDISNVSIHLNNENRFNFSQCNFNNVTFSGDFHNKTFENAKFSHSHFVNADFTYSSFKWTTFDHCDFKETAFKGSAYLQSTIDKGNFWNTDFSQSLFFGAQIHDSIFAKSNFKNIIDYQNNKIEGMHIVFNQNATTDFAFQNATYHEVKPKVALSEDANWYSAPCAVIQEYNSTPISIPEYNYNINDMLLEKEVKTAIDSIRTEGLHGISIAQHVVHSDQPLIKEIKELAYSIMQDCDALWIPGGPDLHPEFYGQQNHSSYPSYSYYREILEFSLADAALALNKPIFGVCHGSQLVNVFLGGTLHQNVYGHDGILPNLNILTYEGPLGSALNKNDSVKGPSYHHQAVDKVADSLEVVAKYNDVIKATQSKDGKPIMLCQFHPEHKADQNSKNILKRFLEFSADSALKKATLKLADIIHQDNHFLDSSSDSHSHDAAPGHHISHPAPLMPAVLPEMAHGEVTLA